MNEQQNIQNINFTIDTNTLYREESITDLKVGAIRRLVPVKPDGAADDTRTEKFLGHTQLMSQEGPIPIQAELPAKTLEEALAAFPAAMKQALAEMVEKIQQLQRQEQLKPTADNRIIVPGR